MRIVRGIAAAAMLTVAGVMTQTRNPLWPAIAVVAGLLLRTRLCGRFSQAVRSLLPIILFASTIMLLEFMKKSTVSLLGLQAAAVCVLVSTAARLLPPPALPAWLKPRTRCYSLVLFFFFTRHFVAILHQESLRLLRARSCCITRPYGRGALRSLGAALTSLFNRSLARAERFFAGQILRGLAK